jgi:predicted P-loop ATPase
VKLPNTAGNPALVAALGYAKRGWPVFPCRPRAKEPANRHGFKEATTEKGSIVAAWTARGTANVAIATGKVSGLVVLDVDPRNGGDQSLHELERLHGPLPETVSVATGGGGRHFYFAAPIDVVGSGRAADGLDVKGDGGYVIAPPSIHPSGGGYTWARPPGSVPLAACPDWVRPAPRAKAVKTAPPDDASTSALGQAFARAGMLGRLLDAGKRTVVCPWQEKHTTGALQDSSTVIFPPSARGGVGAFHCSHSHCSARGTAEVFRELERRALAGTAERAWMAELRRTAKGELKASFGNVVQILSHDPKYSGKLRLDEMRGLVALAELEITDATVSDMRVDIERRYEIQPGDAETARAVQLVASRNAFHPVRDFLLGLRWDGVERIENVGRDVLKMRAESEDERRLLDLLLRRWFVALVARPLEPGCKVDTALIFQGSQGIGKSSFFRVLAGDYFSDTEMGLDKDAMLQLRGAHIYEWAELENVTGRQSVSRVKAFLTSTEDKYRPPFGRTPITVKRSGVIVGSTNNQDFLHDPSGSRRFWVIPFGGVDLPRLKAQREQLLAEAVAARQAGERHWLTDEEEARRAALATRFTETDPWEQRVLEFAAAQEMVRTVDVLTQGLDMPLDRVGRREEMRVTSILKRAGYESRHGRPGGGGTIRYWVDPRKAEGRHSRD